ncbi:MAG TPA: M20/M25/M40 family metallo-hydrolase [Thermoflexia bacterium]|nr:M20/M25/M40 family metallo-hydrolase [Thermoflexia bacterium]
MSGSPSPIYQRLFVVTLLALLYLGGLAGCLPPMEIGEPGPTPLPQFQLPSARTVVPGGARPAPTPTPVPIAGEGPVPADDHVDLARGFDVERALEHITYLASDDLGGRQAGTPDGRAAGNYIAARFAEYGLQPVGLDHTYFQTFTLPYGRITDLPLLEIVLPDGEVLTHTYAYRIDYRALTGGYVGAGEGEGPVVWLNRCDDDAFLGQDVVGKVVLCRYRSDPEVYRRAIEHGVAGLLLVDWEREEPFFRRGAYREIAWVPETIPAYLVSERVAQDLLLGTDYTLDDLSVRFTATPLSTTVRMAVRVEEKEAVEARNVLGLLLGADPEHRDEVVVVGAHYDHLGREPDGAVMHGANDNASGVATMLEIARVWHDAGFRPARTVLFAAWDGEELGLLGSRYYVENPLLPLTRTVAVLNLDMVGGGETLMIDGEDPVAAQLLVSASTFGITATHSSIGRSDHASFIEADVLAAMPIWWPDPVYHSPDDTVEAINPEHLRASGVVAAHALAALADADIDVEEAVARLWAAVATGDRQGFLALIDPTDPDLIAAQTAWFDNLWSRDLTEVRMEPDRVRVGEGEAWADLTVSYAWADSPRRTSSASYEIRFVRRGGAWYLAGPELETAEGEALTVGRFPDVPVGAAQLLTETERAYLRIAADLGLEPRGARVIFYPNGATMRAIARPAADREVRWLAPSAGQVEIAWGEPITPALVSLALNQMGLLPGEAPWLREGLALRYEPDPPRRFLPLLSIARVVTSPLQIESWTDPSPLAQGAAWGLVDYLLDRFGTQGLRSLCAAWGRWGDPARAFRDGLGLSPEEVEAAWRTGWLAPSQADAATIRDVLASRSEAIRTGDVDRLLSTLVADDPALRAGERDWLVGMQARTVLSYTESGQVVGWAPGSAEAVVALTARSVLSGERPLEVTYEARFVRQGGEWRYAGVDWEERASDHFVLRYRGQDATWTQRVLDMAEAAYRRVTADLGAEPGLPQVIEAYDDESLFRFLSLPSNGAGPIRLWLGGGDLQEGIARGLARQVLLARGLRDPWLLEGVAAYEAGRAVPLGEHWVAERYASVAQDGVRRHRDLPLEALSSFASLPDDQVELAQAQAWSMVDYVVARYGMAALHRLVAETVRLGSLSRALPAALGVDPASFLDAWREYALAGGLPEDLVGVAQRFDPQRALEDIAVLSGSDYDGRAAGTPGADRAAAYIAEQFAALGLEPMGDPLTATEAATRGYLQWFPISLTQVLTTPSLVLLNDRGEPLLELAYRDDFVEWGGAGEVEDDLVWVRPSDLEGMRLGGAVVIEQEPSDPQVRLAQLVERGARGVVWVTREPLEPGGEAAQAAVPVPVFRISETAFERLLDRAGWALAEVRASPPALPLGVRLRLTLLRSPLTTTLTANVVGLWPGSDPELTDEVLLIGAHYDHVGRAPDGLLFPGANHNASGVAALLEMARAWKETGYRPARTVLFVAWGAEEVGQAGVAHYLAHPAVPLTRTVGVVALDGIGGGRGYKMLYYGTREHDLPLIRRVETAAAALERRAWRRGSAGEGWHVAFNREGIPTVKMIWEEAEREFYSPDDTVEAIDPDRLAASGEVLTLTVAWLASK